MIQIRQAGKVCLLAVSLLLLAAYSAIAQSNADSVQMFISPDATAPGQTYTTGDTVCFMVSARNLSGSTLTNWNASGDTAIITLHGSTANTDTSEGSGHNGGDPEGYTFAVLLLPSQGGVPAIQTGPHQWRVPAAMFSAGTIEVCFRCTKAERDLYLEVTKTRSTRKSSSARLEFSVGPIRNFLVEITSQDPQPGRVSAFVQRPFELIVSPRDRFQNVSIQEIRTRFTARFPGEFLPGPSQLFGVDIFLRGPTNFFLIPSTQRLKGYDELQYLTVFAADDASVRGRSDDFEVLPHAPMMFHLETPPDLWTLDLNQGAPSTPVYFSWQRPAPPDPWTDIQVTRFSPTVQSDEVTYTIVFLDSVNCAEVERMQSAQLGLSSNIELTWARLHALREKITGQTSNPPSVTLFWYVEATDGLYTTRSTPPNTETGGRCGYKLRLQYSRPDGIHSGTPAPGTSLLALYPDPAASGSTCVYSLSQTGRAQLVLHDMLGREVRTLIDSETPAGVHEYTLDVSGLQPGAYMIRLLSGADVQQRVFLVRR